MKRLTKAAALLAAGTLLLGALISCTPHGAGGAFDSATDNGGGSGSGSGSGSGEQEKDFDTPTKVDALWDFVNASAVPASTPAIIDNTAITAAVDFTAASTLTDGSGIGIGASLNAVNAGKKSNIKFKTTATETEGETGFYAGSISQDISSLSLETIYSDENYYSGKFELTVKYTATVSLGVSGNYDGTDRGAWVVVADSDGTVVKTSEKKLAKGTKDNIVDLELGEIDGGVYTIYMSGSRLHYVKALNDVEEVTPVPITGVTASAVSTTIKVGGSTTLSAAVTPSTTTEDKTVTWAITEGENIIDLDTTGSQPTVTGLSIGTAKVTATVGKFSDTVTIEVTAAAPEFLTGTWTALDYATSTEYADKLSVADGTQFDAVTVFGSGANWRGGGKTTAGADVTYSKWAHLELGKAAAGCLKFKIEDASKIIIKAASTGSTKDSDSAAGISDIWLGTDTNDVKNTGITGSATTVSGTTYTEVTYENVPAGTYYFGAFPAETYARGVRVESIVVTPVE